MSAFHALFTVRTTQGTVAWVIGLIAAPLVAVPMYWVFGSRRFDAYSLVMKEAFAEHRQQIREALHAFHEFRVPRHEIVPAGVGDLASVAGEDFMHGNCLDLLVDGKATFDAILEAVAAAEKTVFVQFYIVREDELGLRVLEALAAKAEAGLDVRFLFDSWGSSKMTEAIREKWRRRGVKMVAFSAHSKWRDRWQLNFRNHRKNVVIDGRIGFVGGHNVGDEYMGKDPKFGRWRDTHVRVEGPSALQLQRYFVADWYFATGEALDVPWVPHPGVGSKGHRALVLASGPSDEFERCTLFFLNVISMAEKRLWIASPYFVPDSGTIQALLLAALRGVDVRILLPMRPDHKMVWLASFALLTELELPNIHVFRFDHGFLHQKVVLVDDAFASVGTANFDNRSFRLNFELTLAVSGKEFNAEISNMLEKDFSQAVEVDRSDYEGRPIWFKAAAQVARLMAPIL